MSHNNNRMGYLIDSISAIKGKKATPASGNFSASGARIEFKGSFIETEYNEDLGFNTDTETNIAFIIECQDNEVSKLGSLLEAIKKIQAGDKKIELNLAGGVPKYGDYKTLYTVKLDISANDFIKTYEGHLK